MKKYYDAIKFGALWGLFQSLIVFFRADKWSMYQILDCLAMKGASFNSMSVLDTMIAMFPIYVFQITYGTFLYQRFCAASVFYFSRCTNRWKWFLKESLQLYLASALYFFTILVVYIGVLSFRTDLVWERAIVILAVYYVVIYSIWAYASVVLMNIIAIKVGSSIGFSILMTVQAISAGILPLWGNEGLLSINDSINLSRNSFLLKCNPIAHIVLRWHSSDIQKVHDYINQLNIKFDLNESVIITIMGSIVVVCIGMVIVQKHELLRNNAEIG